MCGITGIYGLADKSLIRKMTDKISYRGPDSDGYLVDDKISIGFRRLSIIDLSTGDQPIWNEDKNIAITFNGEIYNYLSLKEELIKKGHKFSTSSDTETILHAYEDCGMTAFTKLNGMFAISIYDTQKKKLVLARDSIGIKPIYYAFVNGKLIYGSEIKCILESGEIMAEVDREALSSYLTFGTVLGDKTLFKGIKKLLPSHTLTFDGKRLEITKFTPEKVKLPQNANLYSVLKDSVRAQLMSDVPLGAFLSGGIDSSTIVGLMAEINKETKNEKPIETFTVGFGQESDELKYAKIVSDYFETNHHEIMIVPEDIPKQIDELVHHYDDLTWDSACLPVYLVSSLARKHVKVVLSGEGSDELFAGYERYRPFSNSLPIPKFARFLLYEQFIRMFPNSLRTRIGGFNSSYADQVLDGYKKVQGNALENVMNFEFNEFLPHQLLNKADKATLGASVEGRVPFLDNSVIQFAKTIPLDQKLNGFTGKYVLRQAVKYLVPKITKTRAKKGFGASPIFWFKNKDILNYAMNYLEKPMLKEVGLDLSICKELAEFKGFRPSKKAYQLWSLFLLEKWYREFIK
ncbi:MAG: asparagine synthase (glutamine-hydrolyzing) [Candidatus Micrarchaeota archaeon]